MARAETRRVRDRDKAELAARADGSRDRISPSAARSLAKRFLADEERETTGRRIGGQGQLVSKRLRRGKSCSDASNEGARICSLAMNRGKLANQRSPPPPRAPNPG